MQTRIKRVEDGTGTYYFPQYKGLFFWISFKESLYSYFPEEIPVAFSSLLSAQKFIDKELKDRYPRVTYITYP